MVDQLRNHLNNILPSYVTLNATILLCFTLRTSSSMSSFLNPLFLFLLLLSVTIDFFLTFRKQGHKKWATGRKVRNLHPCLLSYQQMTTVNWISCKWLYLLISSRSESSKSAYFILFCPLCFFFFPECFIKFLQITSNQIVLNILQ